ncbi:MAG TPA: Panacea domain-containing protein, partial [Fodinibius sp.]|nr:Panacea domain-containing protein [Fodinibius sp.]
EDPEEFRKLLKASDVFQNEKLEGKLEFIDRLVYEESRLPKLSPTEFLLGSRKPTEYNGFREPDLEKTMQMILFFAEKLNPWETGMNKLMFYSDFSFFKKNCFSISGIEYRAIKFGPVPKKYAALFEEAEEQGYINVQFDKTRYENTLCKQFLPGKKSFDENLFSTEEFQALKNVAGYFAGKNTSEISDTSHEEDAWLENIGKRQLISYSYAFGLKALN